MKQRYEEKLTHTDHPELFIPFVMDKRGHVYAESRARLQAAAPEMTDDVIARATLLPLAVQLAKRARRVARKTLEGVSQLIPEHTPEPQDAKKPTPAPQKR